jgi:hypothetical protein
MCFIMLLGVGTSLKESVGAPDQMTVSQHSKSEGWHPSPLLLGRRKKWRSTSLASKDGPSSLGQMLCQAKSGLRRSTKGVEGVRPRVTPCRWPLI